MRTTLALVCTVTLAATVYLTLSLLILRPPNANYQEAFLLAALFIAESALTLAVLAGVLQGAWARWTILGGALVAGWAGAAGVRATLSSSHFEGYALVLGSFVVVQAALTLLTFVRPVVFGPRPL